jgi:hypothetical protein
VVWGWRGEISRPPFDPLLTRGTLRGLGNPGSRMGLGKDLSPYKQDVAGSKPASGITTICSTCCRQLFSMPVNEASTRSRLPP